MSMLIALARTLLVFLVVVIIIPWILIAVLAGIVKIVTALFGRNYAAVDCIFIADLIMVILTILIDLIVIIAYTASHLF